MTKTADTQFPVHDLIAKRWSPYAYSDKPVPADDLRSVFEAARWAASSYNEQPWRFLLATKEDPAAFEKMLGCLVEGNQGWAKNAPVLAISIASLRFSKNDKPNGCALHDVGAASAQLTLEATARGLVVHQMGGILPSKILATYGIPDGWQPVAGIAIGYLAEPGEREEELVKRDAGERSRRPLSETVFEGQWMQTASLFE